MHEDTNHVHLSGGMAETHSVPRRGCTFLLPIGRYRLIFNRNGREQQKTIRLGQQPAIVCF